MIPFADLVDENTGPTFSCLNLKPSFDHGFANRGSYLHSPMISLSEMETAIRVLSQIKGINTQKYLAQCAINDGLSYK